MPGIIDACATVLLCESQLLVNSARPVVYAAGSFGNPSRPVRSYRKIRTLSPKEARVSAMP